MKINFIDALEELFEMHQDTLYAKKMNKLMLYAFPYIGIKSDLRIRILKYLYPDYSDEIKNDLINIINDLFKKEQREYHYVALDILKMNMKQISKVENFVFIKNLATNKANWDTVDIYAKDILGVYLMYLPELTQTIVNLLVNSGNTWKIRSAFLFQLNYKEQTNSQLLFGLCKKFIHNKDHFINQAMIWALKEYHKYNPKAVELYTYKNELSLIYKPNRNNKYDMINKLIQEISAKKAVNI